MALQGSASATHDSEFMSPVLLFAPTLFYYLARSRLSWSALLGLQMKFAPWIWERCSQKTHCRYEPVPVRKTFSSDLGQTNTNMCPLSWPVNVKALYFLDPLLVSHCCPGHGGEGCQDQYEDMGGRTSMSGALSLNVLLYSHTLRRSSPASHPRKRPSASSSEECGSERWDSKVETHR